MSARVLSATLLVAFGVVGYKEYKGGSWPPRPFRFWGVVVVWAVLSVLATVAPELAAAFSVAAVFGVYFGALPGSQGASDTSTAGAANAYTGPLGAGRQPSPSGPGPLSA